MIGRHIIKYEYEDGTKLTLPAVWCGAEVTLPQWLFQDAQHAALASEGGIPQCKKCLKAIVKALSEQL